MEELNRVKDTKLKVAAVRNDSFGADLINVAGLVHGRDIISQLAAEDPGDFVMVPHVMWRGPLEDPLLIDDLRPIHLARAFKIPIVGVGNTVEEMFEVLEDWEPHIMSGALVKA